MIFMNKRQANIQELQQEKQDNLKKSKPYKTFSIIANCSAGVSAAFILIGAINNDTETTFGALALCMLLATTGATAAYEGKKYTDLASKIQHKINRTQGHRK